MQALSFFDCFGIIFQNLQLIWNIIEYFRKFIEVSGGQNSNLKKFFKALVYPNIVV